MRWLANVKEFVSEIVLESLLFKPGAQGYIQEFSIKKGINV